MLGEQNYILREQNNTLREQDNMLWDQNSMLWPTCGNNISFLWEQNNKLWEQDIIRVTLHSLKIMESRLIVFLGMERYEDILQLKIHPLHFINFINY